MEWDLHSGDKSCLGFLPAVRLRFLGGLASGLKCDHCRASLPGTKAYAHLLHFACYTQTGTQTGTPCPQLCGPALTDLKC